MTYEEKAKEILEEFANCYSETDVLRNYGGFSCGSLVVTNNLTENYLGGIIY